MTRVTERNLVALARMDGRTGLVYYDEAGAHAIPFEQAFMAGAGISITQAANGQGVTIAATGGGGGGGIGSQVGYAHTVSTTTALTSDTSIPIDTSIPQITEGVAYPYLDTTITPSSALSLLEIDVLIPVSSDTASSLRFALFRDSTANAITSALVTISTLHAIHYAIMRTVVVAGSTSATTFKVRWCAAGGTAYILNPGSVNYFGASSQATMIVREIEQ